MPFSGLSPCDLYGSNYASRSEDSLYRAADRGPAVISIAVTALRLVGELLHWPKPLINSDVCGKAILGVIWLVPIFGIYFAVRLFHAGDTPQRFGRPLLLAISGLVLKLAGTFVMESHAMTYVSRLSMNFIVTLIALVLCAMAWRTLCRCCWPTDTCRAFRWPSSSTWPCVAVGGTHYDALDPGFPPIGFWPTFLRVSFVPNIFFMEAYTAIVGATSRHRRCIRARAGQTRSTGDSSSGTSIEGEQHGPTHVESAIDSKPSRSVRV